jgi:hypothetical protein
MAEQRQSALEYQLNHGVVADGKSSVPLRIGSISFIPTQRSLSAQKNGATRTLMLPYSFLALRRSSSRAFAAHS